MIRTRILALAAMALILCAAAPPPAPGNLFGIAGLTITGAGAWTGVVMIAIYLLREWRETRKLSSDDRQARREGYAKQVESLQGENRQLRADLVARDRLHDDYRKACQSETDQLRTEVRGLEDEVTGLKRRIDAQGTSMARAVAGGLDAPLTLRRLTDEMEYLKGTRE